MGGGEYLSTSAPVDNQIRRWEKLKTVAGAGIKKQNKLKSVFPHLSATTLGANQACFDSTEGRTLCSCLWNKYDAEEQRGVSGTLGEQLLKKMTSIMCCLSLYI